MFAHETAGAARTRLSLRPLVVIEGGNRRKARAHRAARSRGCVCGHAPSEEWSPGCTKRRMVWRQQIWCTRHRQLQSSYAGL